MPCGFWHNPNAKTGQMVDPGAGARDRHFDGGAEAPVAQGDGWPRLRCRMFVERELLNERGYIVLRCAQALEPGEGGQYVEMDKGVGPAAMAVGTSRSRHRLTRQRKR